MKKVRFLLIFVLIFALSALVACTQETVPTTPAPAAPSDLKVEDRVLYWSGVDDADGYKVYIDGKEYETKDNYYAIPDGVTGEVTFAVAAFNAGGSSQKTQLTASTGFKLSAPQNVRQAGDKILWDEVPHALYYIVSINGEEYRADTNEFTVSEDKQGSVKVLAAGNAQGTIISSAFSDVLTLRVILSAPDGIICEDGVIKWNAVDGADGYYVTINGENFTVTKNRFSVKYVYYGETDFSVGAFSNNSEVTSSAVINRKLFIEKATLAAPEGFVDGDMLNFGYVEGATAYELYIDGEFSETIYYSPYRLPADASYVQIKATSETAEASALSDKLVIKVIEIATEEQLVAMKEGGCYKLIADVTMTSARVPTAFGGVLDGDGHTISNVAIETDAAKVGFFARVENATIKNLKISGSINVDTTAAKMAVGALAGECIGSTVENCEITFDITAKTTNGVGTVGGAFGLFENSSATSVAFKGDVTTYNAVTGGFIGKADEPYAINRIKNCYAQATVTANGGEQAYCGGFIGQFTDNCLTVSACFADCAVTGVCYVGGFVGYMGSGKIVDCYTAGTVTATDDTLVHIGGFIGRLEGYNTSVTRCIAMAQVVCNASGEHVLIGGFVGRTVGGTYNANIYEDCFYDKTVNNIDRVGSGRGDGITAKSTDELKSAATYYAFDSSVWKVVDGELPSLG